MSVLIKGMEMPKAGNWKTIRIYYDGTCTEPNWQGDCKYMQGCEAVSVPPHGRLIDAVERKKGKWQITDAYPHNVYCSECHKKFAQTHWAVWEDGSLPRNFCPNCGADMRHPDD